MSFRPDFTYAENVLRVRRLKDGNISHVTARAEMTSTLVSSIHSERSRRLRAKKRTGVRSHHENEPAFN